MTSRGSLRQVLHSFVIKKKKEKKEEAIVDHDKNN
jgi:hypothetical protein